MTRKKIDTGSQEYAWSIMRTIREPMVAIDRDLNVLSISRSFYKLFRVKPDEAMGQHIYEINNNQLDIPRLRELLKNILSPKATFNNYEVEHDFAGIGRRVILLNAWQIKIMPGKERIIFLAIEDITDRREMEEACNEKISCTGNDPVFTHLLTPLPALEKAAGTYDTGTRSIKRMVDFS